MESSFSNNSNNISPVLVLGELSLVHCMGTAGIPVITGSEHYKTYTAYSKYSHKHVIFSDYESEKFIDELCRLGDKTDQKMPFVTYDDRALLNISAHRDRLKEYFLFTLPEHGVVEKLLDKLVFCDVCEDLDLPAPKSLKISDSNELMANIDKLKAPYLIKPAYRHYWFHKDFSSVVGNYQKAYRCNTVEELLTLYSKICRINPHVVVQEYIIGKDSSLYDVNFHIDNNGEIKSYVIAQKIRVYPPTAGWGSFVRTVHNEQIYGQCLEIIKKLKLKGLINIQFKKDARTEEFKLIEIHTRTSIFDFLGVKAGQNVLASYYAALTENSDVCPPGNGYRENVNYINLDRDLRLFIRYRKNYEVPLSTWLKTYFKTSVFDGILLNDLYPVLRKVI